jgi:hypothetical protein
MGRMTKNASAAAAATRWRQSLWASLSQTGCGRLDGIVGEVAFDVGGEGACRGVAAVAVFLQGFHDDPVEVAA